MMLKKHLPFMFQSSRNAVGCAMLLAEKTIAMDAEERTARTPVPPSGILDSARMKDATTTSAGLVFTDQPITFLGQHRDVLIAECLQTTDVRHAIEEHARVGKSTSILAADRDSTQNSADFVASRQIQIAL